jgi:desulfoferrodoxin-like iron-binding protein
MGVEKTGEIYRCTICGNEVAVIIAGGGTLICCGQKMNIIDGIHHPEMSHRTTNSDK